MDNALGKKLRKLRNEQKWTLGEVAEKLGLKSYSTYSNWEHGRSKPDDDMLLLLADLYNVPYEEMFDLAHPKLTMWNSHTPGTGKTEAMMRFINSKKFKENDYNIEFVFNDPPLYTSSILNVPILGTIRAGLPILAQEHIKDWMRIPNMWNLKEGEVFVLEVVGDSMIGSRIYEGDKVIVKVQPDVENGEIAVVNVNGEDATLKRVKKINGQVILYPDNPRYEPMVVQHEDARIIGKVIQVMFEPGK